MAKRETTVERCEEALVELVEQKAALEVERAELKDRQRDALAWQTLEEDHNGKYKAELTRIGKRLAEIGPEIGILMTQAEVIEGEKARLEAVRAEEQREAWHRRYEELAELNKLAWEAVEAAIDKAAEAAAAHAQTATAPPREAAQYGQHDVRGFLFRPDRYLHEFVHALRRHGVKTAIRS